MQCNTNYTGSFENFKHINLNVLKNFKKIFPDAILGLSDHTKTLSTVLGSVALGARVKNILLTKGKAQIIHFHYTRRMENNGRKNKRIKLSSVLNLKI